MNSPLAIDHTPPEHLPHPSEKGFALVATLSLMILLTIIAVGLLSLSSISLRATSSSHAMNQARANARMSMIMAVAQLQSLSGQDTRVTASSQLRTPSSVPTTGVWRSWEGNDHAADGKPIRPDYASKNRPGDPSVPPERASNNTGRFLGWLTSTAAAATPDANRIPDVASTGAPGLVKLVAEGSASASHHHVFMRPTMIHDNQGSIAWWTSGDNSKAMINIDREAQASSIVQSQQRVRSNGRADAETFGLGAIDSDPGTYPPGRKELPSTGNLKLAAPRQDLRKIHDLTAYSKGLLTNTATGGWKKDLSIMSENYASLPAANLPFFTIAPGRDLLYTKSQPTGTGGRPLLYPWDNYRAGGWWAASPPISSWNALVNYTQQYRNFPPNAQPARTAMRQGAAFGRPDDRVGFNEQVRRIPQLARIQWIYSIGSRRVPGTDPSATATYNPGILVTPVLTLWNPYNVEMTVNNYWVAVRYQPNPLEFEMRFNRGTPWRFASRNFMTDRTRINEIYFHLLISNPFTLAPGATMIFSLANRNPVVNPASTDLLLQPGYTSGGGNLYTRIGPTRNEITATASDHFEISRITYERTDVRDWGGNGEGFGMFFNVMVNAPSLNTAGYSDDTGTAVYITPHRMRVAPFSGLGGDAAFSRIYPPITSPVSRPVSSIDVATMNARPFATALFGYRAVSPFFAGSRFRHLYSKGLLQTNPLCGYTDDTGYPLRAPYSFAFMEMDGWNTDAAPEFERSTNSSYIVSGLNSRNGLTRCVMVELPTRPLQSLADLQHFDARNNNPHPPHQLNLIANGSAHPQFAPVQAIGSDKSNDDSFLLNHLLFDDWFCSSIADDVTDFGSASERTAEQVYQDHLTRTQPLPNRLYEPAPGAASPNLRDSVAEAAVSGARAGVPDSVTGKFSFESIASKLVVNGMFNINSVSLEAWRSILRQSRETAVPYLAADGSTRLGARTSFSYPRTSIAGDQGSNSGSTDSNPLFPGAAEFAGHRVLTEVQIDALAELIVGEIQRRGPFLSLAEFTNRQLTSDRDLAIASPVQRALDRLAALGPSERNPFAGIQSIAQEITEPAPGIPGYGFPEAALGSSAFGVPGWIRQADILRPLAPIISARDDTFTIRAYGDSRDRADPSKIAAKAWCEVVVQRQAAYVDPIDSAAVAPYSTSMSSPVNRRFGRRYQIVSFRWLVDSEI
jgi:hypothetical protein